MAAATVGASYESIPKDKDDDLKIFHVEGRVTKGAAALDAMADVQLVLWLAGNQFFAMELIVAKGNPKRIMGIDDLARIDVRSMLPNPVDEGIMTFYAKPVLQRNGLWERLAGGKECKSCQPTSKTYFTAVHHRETPMPGQTCRRGPALS